MGIPAMPTGYQHAYTLGYRWVFMGIDGYFDDSKKAAGSWLLGGYQLPAASCHLQATAEEPLWSAGSRYRK